MTRRANAFRSGLSRIHGNRSAEDAIHAIANDVRRNHARRKDPPYEPRACARSLGVGIERGHVTGGGALDGWSSEHPRIILPALEVSSTHRRENFTIAHELGHFVLRSLLGRAVPRAELEAGHAEEEYFCNLFAAEFLVPRADLLTAVHKYGLTPRFVLWFADLCDVSPQVVARRFGEIYRERFISMMWQRRAAVPECAWWVVTPKPTRPFELPRTGKSTVERAIYSSEQQIGCDTFISGARRARWQCVSQRIGSSDSVLTVGIRASTSVVLGSVAPLPSVHSPQAQMKLFS